MGNTVSQAASRSRSARRLDQQARREQRYNDVANYGEVIVLALIDEALVEARLHERLRLRKTIGEDDVGQQQTQRLFGHGETGLVGEAEILGGQEQPHHRHLNRFPVEAQRVVCVENDAFTVAPPLDAADH